MIAALRKKFPNIANPPKDDICYATQNRQEAVRELAAQADLVLVLGSQNSSNSRRLAEIANGLGIPSLLDRRRLRDSASWFRDVETVLITAGASAPEQVVQECIEYLERNFGATIREETVRKESVHFPLPKSLRQLLPAESSVETRPIEPTSTRPSEADVGRTRSARPGLTASVLRAGRSAAHLGHLDATADACAPGLRSDRSFPLSR